LLFAILRAREFVFVLLIGLCFVISATADGIPCIPQHRVQAVGCVNKFYLRLAHQSDDAFSVICLHFGLVYTTSATGRPHDRLIISVNIVDTTQEHVRLIKNFN
jgi:hypothetical protein